ncbi:2-hydroxyacid dehydrogenase [Pseudosulfitobacter koreensis]|uniref:2-hydroxyacid dehydrogenase n=1 Tax=Pseudosulfitobacter koreensis TaxID=2968472 RepID=A0ABT1Z1J4_9RHOB|nr:2-hydroxyacid dehydrogenase [Pseudosulfitobacter koreense]MCR8827013.1 2-hydroxyacid dehydrogenase [Pseudosulfitobacter koreense]
MSAILAVGPYTEAERDAFIAELQPTFIATRTELDALDGASRAAVKAIAYKGHRPFGPEEMDQFENLGVIANFGVGYDAIDVGAASARGIKVTNTPDVLNDDVADLAIAMWLMQAREMRQAEAWVRDGSWAEKGATPLNRKVSGGTVGVMGMGRIGRDIADRLAAFKCEVHYHARSQKDTPGWTYHADPVELARAVDYLFVALVGGPETENYVSKEVIAALGEAGVIINISRGSTIDEEAMLDALESGAIAGAGLDVFVGEPKVNPRFLALDNVVLQPHQGSATHATRAAMAKLQRDNVAAHLAGRELLTPVN